MASFKKWNDAKKKEGKKIVRYPICWSYEEFVRPTNYYCKNCGKEYCQKCLKIIVSEERRHDHEKKCCNKSCRLIRLILLECDDEWEFGPFEYFYMTLLYLFGTPILFTIKYFNYFRENHIIDNDCVHWFFAILNFIF